MLFIHFNAPLINEAIFIQRDKQYLFMYYNL